MGTIVVSVFTPHLQETAIEQKAIEQLQMQLPELSEIVMVSRD